METRALGRRESWLPGRERGEAVIGFLSSRPSSEASGTVAF